MATETAPAPLTDKWLFILGAGASQSAIFKLPLMKGFFDEHALHQYECHKLRRYIDDLYPGQELNNVNLEDLATHMDLSAEGLAKFWFHPEGNPSDARLELDDYIRRRLETHDKEVCPLHKIILAGITERDSIITLNQDLIVDRVLFYGFCDDPQPNKAPNELYVRRNNLLGFGRGNRRGGSASDETMPFPDKGVFLQLHGAVDWAYCQNPVCPKSFLFVQKSHEPAFRGQGSCDRCGGWLRMGIVPPTMAKTFERFPVFGIIWRLALRELQEATHVVVMGVSFTKSDYYLRWLVRESARRRRSEKTPPASLHIANPSTDDQAECKALFESTPKDCYPDLEALAQNWGAVRPQT